MRRLRQLIFWLHLSAGTLGGFVILTMSATGLLLVYERQITAWVDHSQYLVLPPSGAAHLPIETLLAVVRDSQSVLPSAITLRSDPSEPAAFSMGTDLMLYVDPYSGKVLGEGSQRFRAIFRAITSWHRWLGAEGASRDRARAITGACNLIFLFLVTSGPYLWWPRTWTWAQVKSVIWFRRRLPGKARDFNWHNVIGFWSAIPLFIVVASGVVISYPWASNLVYRVVGEEPPVQGRSGSAAVISNNRRGLRETETSRKQDGNPQGEGAKRRGEPGERSSREAPGSPTGFTAPPLDLKLDGLNGLWARAEQQVSGWQSISMRLPVSVNADVPVTFNIDEGNGGQPQKRSQLTLERTTGQIVRWEPFSSLTRGRQLRSLLRFAHTGEVAGIFGQTVAGIAAGGSTVLVWTGLALACRRFWAWRERRRSKEVSAADSLVGRGIIQPRKTLKNMIL